MPYFRHKIFSFFRYLRRRQGARWLHSPFVFAFYREVIWQQKSGNSGQTFGTDQRYFDKIEALRKKRLQDKRAIQVTDLGAGSQKMKTTSRRIADIAKYSLSSTQKAQFFYRVIQYFNSKTILELGTSLGVTTAYLQLAASEGIIYTFEGCPKIAEEAKETLLAVGDPSSGSNPEIIVGDLSKTLSETLSKISRIDFLLLDANHRYQPTLDYFELCLPKCYEETVVILDDIYWSPDMTKAWRELQNHPAVTTSIDIFSVGLLFFHQKHPKQDFILKNHGIF